MTTYITSQSSNRAAKLPAIPAVPTSLDAATRQFLEAVKERMEVREGSRGDPAEAVVTKRDLQDAGLLVSQGLKSGSSTGVLVQAPGGGFSYLPIGALVDKLIDSNTFKTLLSRIDNPYRFDGLPDEVKSILLTSIAQEASRRGADIRNLEQKIQTESRSLAYKVSEVTASLQQSAAGVRGLQMAYATADEARAESIQQLESRLLFPVSDSELLPPVGSAAYANISNLPTTPDPEKFYRVANPSYVAGGGEPKELLYAYMNGRYEEVGTSDGVYKSAKLEQRLSTVANRTTGLEASYTVKVSAGGAVAGFGLAAEDNLAGSATSAFVVQVDKFALVSPNEPVSAGIDTKRVPFGVDTRTGAVYINGDVRIGSGAGQTVAAVAEAAGVVFSYDTQFFKYDAVGTAINSTVTLTANVTGSVKGSLSWRAVAGYSGSVPSAVSVTTPGVVSSATINVNSLTGDNATFEIKLVDSGGATYTDTVTLSKIRDGSDAFIAILTNDSAGVATTNAGTPLSNGFSGASGVMEVYRGVNKATTGVTYSVSANTSGLSVTIGSTGAYSVSGKGSWQDTSNTASIEFKAVVANGPTLTKILTLTKNRQAIYTDYIFYRSSSAPPTPPTGWSDTPPSGTGVLYMSSALRNVSDESLIGSWSAPVRLDGEKGADGAYQQYQWAVNKSDVTPPTSGWSNTPITPAAGEFLWMRQGAVIPPATAPASGSWGSPYRVSGEKGDSGIGQVKGIAFYRGTTAPPTPTGGSFNSPTPTTSGWSDGIPSGTNPLYMSTRLFTSDGSSPQQAAWTTPQLASAIGAGAKLEFSVDGANNWHETPTINDVYMRTLTSIDGGKTWVPGGAVKIKGENGKPGDPGPRGTAFGYGASATDAEFNKSTGLTAQKGDQMLVSNSSSGSTIYTRGASSWAQSSVFHVDGDAVISGTLYAGTSVTSRAIIGASGVKALTSVYVSNGTYTTSVTLSGIGTPLFTWAATDVPGVGMSLQWTGHTSTSVTFRLHAWNRADGTPWSGTVGVLNIWVY